MVAGRQHPPCAMRTHGKSAWTPGTIDLSTARARHRPVVVAVVVVAMAQPAVPVAVAVAQAVPAAVVRRQTTPWSEPNGHGTT